MLPYRRLNGLPSGRAESRYASLSRPGLRVYVCGSRGVVFDTRVLGPALPTRDSTRLAQVTIALGGDYLVRRGRDLTMAAGEFLAEGRFPWDEQWAGDDFQVLVVEWSRDHGDLLGAPSSGRLDVATLALSKQLASSFFDGPWNPGAGELALTLLGRLRSLGIPLAPLAARDLDQGISAHDRAFCRRLGEVESRLEDRPMWMDVESAIERSARQLRRDHRRVFSALSPIRAESFRRSLRGRRVRTAATLVTARDVSLEEVSCAVGYGSVRALILAMQQEGLPTPGAIRRACPLRRT